MMNSRRSITAFAAVLAAGTAFVQPVFADDPQPKTRAQVYAELEQSRADGSFYSLGEGTPRRQTRARLAAQEAQARRAAAAAAADAGEAHPPAAVPQRAGS